MTCSCCGGASAVSRHFDEKKVREELEGYRRTGPAVTTTGLLRLLLPAGQARAGTALDIGSGFGALTFGLLAGGVEQATCVDLSPASVAVGTEEAGRRGLAGRISWREGDFVALADELPPADLVTLDRVVCCYPEYAPLLTRAAEHAERTLALSYPRARWTVRLAIGLENLWRKVRGNPFRAFVHPPARMAELLVGQGFTRTRSASTWTWQIDVYARNVARGE